VGGLRGFVRGVAVGRWVKNIYNRKMIFNKPLPKDKKSSSSKKVHRRVITEAEEAPLQSGISNQLKKS
jgi:23S rRNA C2498 (ribose-2'-O)-methylase RlmM